jgi:hypothetical protein
LQSFAMSASNSRDEEFENQPSRPRPAQVHSSPAVMAGHHTLGDVGAERSNLYNGHQNPVHVETNISFPEGAFRQIPVQQTAAIPQPQAAEARVREHNNTASRNGSSDDDHNTGALAAPPGSSEPSRWWRRRRVWALGASILIVSIVLPVVLPLCLMYTRSVSILISRQLMA